MSEATSFFVSAQWLEDNLDRPGLVVVDASWYLPAQGRDARAEYDAGHIRGAVFFDQDQVVDPEASLPHTLPRPEDFARMAGAMGIAADDTIVVHDGPGLFSAPRVWWMFRIMGARDVRILEGGIDGWKRDGRLVTDDVTKIAPCLFKAELKADRVASIDDVLASLGDTNIQIADARPSGRFTGAEPEPRAGVRGGHMPGARNLPAASLAEGGKLLSPEALRERFDAAGIDRSKPVITSCGSGITAAVITLALETLGHTDNRLYDGSWTEWGSRPDTPVESGEAVAEGEP